MHHLLSEPTSKFFRHSLRNRHRSNTSRLRTPNPAASRIPKLRQVLSNLRGLARSSLSNNNQQLVVVYGLNELVFQLEDGQALSLLQQMSASPSFRTRLVFHPLRTSSIQACLAAAFPYYDSAMRGCALQL